MKSLYRSSYRFFKPEQKPETILALSDIHFDGRSSADMHRALVFARKQSPALITISGDLVDNLDAISSHTERENLKVWLEQLGEVAPVCLCLGNHDFYRKTPEFRSAINHNGKGYVYDSPAPLIAELATLKNIYLLDNEAYENDKNYVFGITLPPHLYDREGNPDSKENQAVFSAEIKRIAEKFAKLPKRKTKILLVHSPVFLKYKAIRKLFDGFDFVFAGHMHNGIVPPLLQEVWRGHSGIVTPSKKFFRDDNTRLGLYYNHIIGLGAVTTVQTGAKPFGWANKLYPTYVATIEVGHNIADERKPDIKNKYEK